MRVVCVERGPYPSNSKIKKAEEENEDEHVDLPITLSGVNKAYYFYFLIFCKLGLKFYDQLFVGRQPSRNECEYYI